MACTGLCTAVRARSSLRLPWIRRLQAPPSVWQARAATPPSEPTAGLGCRGAGMPLGLNVDGAQLDHLACNNFVTGSAFCDVAASVLYLLPASSTSNQPVFLVVSIIAVAVIIRAVLAFLLSVRVLTGCVLTGCVSSVVCRADV